MTHDRIRFNKPSLEGNELEYVRQSIEEGHTSSGGPFSQRAAELLRDVTGAREVLLTTSCTSALELAAMMVDVEPGDKVVVPSFSFTSTALAYARQGAKLLFCDIEPRTLGLDPAHLATLMDETVKAVVVVHYAGVACDIDGIQKVLAEYPQASLIEDNAHALFGRWHGKALGTFGRFGAQSFHETKNFTCGEGGAILINDDADVARARVLYDKGTDRQAFLLGQVDKYSWQDTGSSFGISDTLAAVLLGQLEKREVIQQKRRRLHDWYTAQLAPYAAKYGYTLAEEVPGCDSAWHMFYVLLPDRETRDGVLRGMAADNVTATFHYVPLHSSKGGRAFAARYVDCPVTDDISGRLIRLPFYNNIEPADADRVVASFLGAVDRLAGA